MTATQPQRSAGLRTAGLLVVALVALAAALTAGGAARAPLATAPALPLPTGEARCPTDGPATAAARAAAAAAAADWHMARYPFASREGPRALSLLAEARACLALAPRSGEGADDTASARDRAPPRNAAALLPTDAALAERTERYRVLITGDYRDRVTRVRHVLARRRPGLLGAGSGLPAAELEHVRADVGELLALLAGRDEEFVAELRGLQLELDAGGAGSALPGEGP